MAYNTHSLDLELSSNQYAWTADTASLSITGDITVEGWVRFETLPSVAGTSMAICAKGYSTDSDESWVVYLTTANTLRIIYSEDGTTGDRTIITSTNALSAVAETWMHFAIAVDVGSATASMYMNGVPQASSASSTSALAIYDGNGGIGVGAIKTSGAPVFELDGEIAEVRVWNDIRTATEISDNIFNDVTGQAGLVAYWKFNNDYTDETANGNDLTSSGSPVFNTAVPFPTYTDLTGQVELASLTDLSADANLVAYYKLADVTDEEGGTSLTNTNSVTFSTGKFGNGADFGVSNTDKILELASDHGIVAGAVSLVGWVKLTATVASIENHFITQQDAGTQVGNYLSMSSTLIRAQRLRSGISADQTQWEALFTTGIWYHLAYTYDATTVKLYINGIIVAQIASSGNGSGSTLTADAFGIGARVDPDAGWNEIMADDVAIFSDALTATEVFTLYTGVTDFSASPSLSESPSPSPSESPSPSSSPSPSLSISLSPSLSISLSPSLSPSISVSLSLSLSPSLSPSSSQSPSASPSISESLSISLSPSASQSPSSSISPSPSLSISLSPSLSISLSPSASDVPSESLSPSLSPSFSGSSSPSLSISASPSNTPSSSVSPSISPPPATINSGKVTVASDTTVSSTLEDITGLSTTVTIVNSAEIVVFMSLQGANSSANKTGSFAVDVNGVNSPTFTREFTTAGANGSIGVIWRSGTLGFGTYTVKGEYAITGGTLTATNATLVAFATEDSNGNAFKNVYDTVASDTTTSATLEDIDGLTQSLTTDGNSHIFGVESASVAVSGGGGESTIALDINGESHTTNRGVGSGGDAGSVAVVGRTVSKLASASYTIKGQHSVTANTLTTAPITMFAMEMGSEELFEIPSSENTITSASTTSNSLVDITGTNHEVTLTQTAHIFAVMSIDAVNTSASSNQFAININGVDYPVITRTMSAGSSGAVFMTARTTATLGAGTYVAKGRWATNVGTLSIDGQSNMVTFALVNESTSSPSLSPSLSISLSPSSSASPSSSISPSPSVSVSLSASLSPSLSISLSPSLSISLSPSLSPSSSESPSPSLSISLSPSSSQSPSASDSLSPSLSVSLSISPSPSTSESLSPSLSPSLSVSLSPSISQSSSPSSSPSLSISPSPSVSVSRSPSLSISPSPSVSESLSLSLSPSTSISPSPSVSISASPSVGYAGYTRGDEVALPTDDTDLETDYSAVEVVGVATRDNTIVGQSTTSQYMIHQFKYFVGSATIGTIVWEGITDLAPTTSNVVLQIYNQVSNAWESLATDSTGSADINFEFEYNIDDLTNYKDASNVVSSRVYQLATGTDEFSSDYFKIIVPITYGNTYTETDSLYIKKYSPKNTKKQG